MINLVEQIIGFVDFNYDYFYIGNNKKLIGFERNVLTHPFTKDELSYLGRDDFTNEPLTKEEASQLLANDVNRIEEQIKHLIPWSELNKPRQAVCVNLAMILGVNNFLKIENKLQFLKNCFYENFVRFFLGLKVCERHTSRINTMAEQMLTGEWC